MTMAINEMKEEIKNHLSIVLRLCGELDRFLHFEMKEDDALRNVSLRRDSDEKEAESGDRRLYRL